MGELCELISMIKEDKNQFYLLMDRFKPLINKYTGMLYRDERDDIYAEFIMALWESVQNLVFYENDGQVVNFITNALKNKYLEMYRTSRKWHDNIASVDKSEIEVIAKSDSLYDDILTWMCLKKIYDGITENKREIFMLIFKEGLSDIEVATRLQMSRQYVHRIRKEFYEKIKKEIEG